MIRLSDIDNEIIFVNYKRIIALSVSKNSQRKRVHVEGCGDRLFTVDDASFKCLFDIFEERLARFKAVGGAYYFVPLSGVTKLETVDVRRGRKKGFQERYRKMWLFGREFPSKGTLFDFLQVCDLSEWKPKDPPQIVGEEDHVFKITHIHTGKDRKSRLHYRIGKVAVIDPESEEALAAEYGLIPLHFSSDGDRFFLHPKAINLISCRKCMEPDSFSMVLNGRYGTSIQDSDWNVLAQAMGIGHFSPKSISTSWVDYFNS